HQPDRVGRGRAPAPELRYRDPAQTSAQGARDDRQVEQQLVRNGGGGVSGREKRVFPRWMLHAAVDVESEDNLYAGLSYDVSAGGIFVATFDTPPIGSEVAVTVTLPDGSKIELEGQVRWVRDSARATPGLPAGCGIEWN